MKLVRIIGIMLVLAIVVSFSLILPAADSTQKLLGDADGDGIVNINDVTAVQRHVAEIESVNAAFVRCADVDGNGSITVEDATAIQSYLAEFGNPYHIGEAIAEETQSTTKKNYDLPPIWN